MSETKKYYWLKLKKDFFKRHDIQIIESMENGKEYVLFYLKLLAESVSHNGELRFSETIPYNDKMLSTITNTNIDIVRSAVKLLRELELIVLMDDDTIYMEEVTKMLGSETEWAEKKRKYRQEKQIEIGQCPKNVLPMSDKSKILEIDTDTDKEIEKENNNGGKPPAHSDFENLFEEWWKLYPVKKEKQSCKVEYLKILKERGKEFHNILLTAINEQIDCRKRADAENEMRKNDNKELIWLADWIYPIRWLKRRRWEDEIAEVPHLETTEEYFERRKREQLNK